VVGRGGVEPPTFRFSGGRSYQLSYLPSGRTPVGRRSAYLSQDAPPGAASLPTLRSVPTCGSCGRELPGDFPFCPYCATPIVTSPTPREQQRRVVTVLFCDLVGSTAAAEGADVEDVQSRLARYHALVRERIEAFGGVVEKYVGDAVMAVFGAPTAHEDDAERAVRAGLSIIEVVDALDDVHVRVGLNTGEALVAVDARPESGESFVVGDTVNTAARLQSAAPTDGVVVGEATYRATDRVFEYASLEPFDAKGKAEPIAVWQALAAKSRFGTDLMRDLKAPMIGRSLELETLVNALERARRGEAQVVTVIGDAGVGKSRLVGALFSHVDALNYLVTWRQGRCLPYGEGVRFWALAEIIKAHLGIYDGDSDEAVMTKLEVIRDELGEPWVRSAIAALLGVADNELPVREVLVDALRRFVDVMVGDQVTVLVVEDLHWADDSLLDFLDDLTGWAAGIPLLVVGTARPELLTRRPAWGGGTANAANVRVAPLSPSETSELISGRLGELDLPTEVRLAVVERSGGNPLYAEEFVRMLQDRAELGSDASVSDNLDSTALPDTVQSLIAARLDTLDPAARHAVLDAAVLGKVMWAGGVAALGDRDRAETEQALRELVRKEMIRPMRRSSLPGDAEYAFTHVLVRDVAYGQLTRHERARKHAAALAWIEQTAGTRSAEFAEILVHHATSGLELAEAVGDQDLLAAMRRESRRWLTAAARQLKESDHARAWRYMSQAFELPGRETADPAEEAEMLEVWVGLAAQEVPNEQTWQVAQRMVELRRTLGDEHALAVSLGVAAFVAYHGGRRLVVERLREEALALLAAEGDSDDHVMALVDAAFTRHFSGERVDALRMSQEALDMARRLGPPGDTRRATALRGALNVWALVRATSGDPQTRTVYDEAAAIATEWSPVSKAIIENNRFCLYALQDGTTAFPILDDAIAACEAQELTLGAAWLRSTGLAFRVAAGDLRSAMRIADDIGQLFDRQGTVVAGEAWSAWFEARVELGELIDASRLAQVEAVVADNVGDDAQTDQRIIVPLGPALTLAASGERQPVVDLLHRMIERPVDAFELAPRLARYARVTRMVGAFDVLRVLAERVPPTTLTGQAGDAFCAGVLAEADEPAGAAPAFDRARAAFEQLGFRLDAAYALALAGLCRTRLDDEAERERGHAQLDQARAWFEEMGAAWAARRCRGSSEGGPDGI
jgi:class 3 adenylate cyclase